MVVLSNGLRVANFSSPHSFVFTDGRILNAVSEYDSLALSMEPRENIIDMSRGYKTIAIRFTITEAVRNEVMRYHNMWLNGHVDVVIVPRPLIDALTAHGHLWGYGWASTELYLLNSPFRTCRVADRISKIIEIDKFCI